MYFPLWQTVTNCSLARSRRFCNTQCCLSFCMFLCMVVCWQLYIKTTERIFMNILPDMCLGTRKNGLNCGRHPPLDLELGLFWRILHSCKRGSYLWKKNWSDHHEIFFRDVSVDMEVPIKFWKCSWTASLHFLNAHVFACITDFSSKFCVSVGFLSVCSKDAIWRRTWWPVRWTTVVCYCSTMLYHIRGCLHILFLTSWSV